MEALFSDQVRDILQTSRKLAARFKYDHIDSEHLLLSIIDESLKNKNAVLEVLKHFNINIFNLIEDIEASFNSTGESVGNERIPFTKKTESILKLSYLEAKTFLSSIIESEHLFLSYLRGNPAFCERTLNAKYELTYDKVKSYLKFGG
jgi:ATP-dependent Clp protease ATP-binding subunit ClpC